MNIEFINPFVSAAVNVLRTMAATDLKVGKISKRDDTVTLGEVTGIIGMASQEISGNMVLSFERKTILGIVHRMLMEEFTEINHEVVDAVGELTNMICGGAKGELNKKGYLFDMASPVMVVGKNVEITQMSEGPTMSIPFYTQDGMFVVEANLSEKE